MDANRRLILFVCLSAIVLGAWMLLNQLFGPPAPVAQPNQPDVPAEVENDDDPGKIAPAVDAGEEPPEVVEDLNQDADQPEAVAEEDRLPTEQHYLAVGSIDPETGYRFLATFNSIGGTIERLELSDPKFHELEAESGYLGNLSLSNEANGVKINVNLQGVGTPADLAGLRKGDVIRTFDGEEVANVNDFIARLEKTRPGDEVTLGVIKIGAEKATDVAIELVIAPVAVIRPENPVRTAAEGDEVAAPAPLVHSFRATLRRSVKDETGKVSDVQLSTLLNEHWELTSPKDLSGDSLARTKEVVFERTLNASEQEKLGLSAPMKMVKRYRIAPVVSAEAEAEPPTHLRNASGYHLTLDLEIHNLGDEAKSIGYQIHGPNGLPTEGWWYAYKIGHGWGAAGIRDVLRKTAGLGADQWTASMVFHNILNDTQAKNDLFTDLPNKPEQSTVDFAGVDSRYFASALIPGSVDEFEPVRYVSGKATTLSRVSEEEKPVYKLTNVSFFLNSTESEVAPNEEGVFKQSFVIFAGPKQTDLLSYYKLDDFIYYGWFGLISKALLGLLHLLYYFCWNYALAIVLLTLFVRACLLPFSRKATKNMLAMQAMAPEMKVINEKYKNDLEKRGEALRALYKKYNHNPMSGCLPMLLQFPIFMALYRGLAADIELRGAPLIPGVSWCSNMAAPDQLLFWGTYPEWFFAYTGWLGPYLNVLPLVTVVLFILQQRIMAPPATDEQTAQTQKMTQYMMLMVGFMFFKVPSGLCIYFITSSIWGLIERKLLPKPKVPDHIAKTALDAENANPEKGEAARKHREKKRNKR